MINKQNGSTLLEGLISICIFSFGVLGTMAFQSNMLALSMQTSNRLTASMYIASLSGAMNADPAKYKCYQYPIESIESLNLSSGGGASNCNNVNAFMTTWAAKVAELKDYVPGNGTAEKPNLAVLNGDNLEINILWQSDKEREKHIDPHKLTSTLHPVFIK